MNLNLHSLRQVLNSLYEELPHIPAALGISDGTPSTETLAHNFLTSLTSNDQGQDLLFRYKLGLYQIRNLNKQATRLANQTSTRMSSVQQDINEHWEAVCHMHDRISQLPSLSQQVDDLNRQISEFEKFLAQTEIAVLSLEALDDKVKEEEMRRKPPSLMDVS